MSVEGLCQVCSTRPAEHQCLTCGGLVCEVHFDDDRGVCSACASDIPPDDRDGADEYRF